MIASVPSWAELVVAALLVMSGVFVVVSAVGFLLLKHFFLRMHPPALAYTFGSWCVALASILYFSLLESRPVLHPWLIIILLSISVAVTTLLLARAALFRRRVAGIEGTPPPLTAPAAAGTRQMPVSASSAQVTGDQHVTETAISDCALQIAIVVAMVRASNGISSVAPIGLTTRSCRALNGLGLKPERHAARSRCSIRISATIISSSAPAASIQT